MFKVLVNTTTIKETTNVPHTTNKTSISRPINVLGKKSPYPTVVIVIMVSHNAF